MTMGQRSDAKHVLICGYGQLSGPLVDLIWQLMPQLIIHVAGHNRNAMDRRANLSRYVSLNLGRMATVATHACDLDDLRETTEVIREVRPCLIFNGTTTLPWWKLFDMPLQERERFIDDGGSGTFAACDAWLTYRLMQAVREAESNAFVVNGAYPDVVNPLLLGVGLAPDVGVGNLANAVPGIRMAISLLRGCPPEDVQVRLIAQHWIGYTMPSRGHTSGCPYILRAWVNGVDVSDELDHPEVFRVVVERCARVRGLAAYSITASSAAMIIRAILEDRSEHLHAPGPLGLPGGYPIIANASGVRLDLPSDVSAQEAEDINRRGLPWDGIESIDGSGNLLFTEKARQMMTDLFRVSCDGFNIRDARSYSEELIAKFAEYRAERKLP